MSKQRCQGCGGAVTPVYNPIKHSFKGLHTCKVCANSGKTSYWEAPFDFDKMMDKTGLQWAERHPEYPAAFIDTDINRLGGSLKSAVNWMPSDKPFLVLHGTTGAGKSRTAWLVFNRIWLNNFPDKAVWLPMRKLEAAIEKGFDDHKHGQVLDYFCNVPLLAFDDLGKERLTARMESDLFGIIDERTQNLKTTIITTNYNGQSLLERFGNQETGQAFIRRIREFSTAVQG
jgi:DNA replication protein DnaC